MLTSPLARYVRTLCGREAYELPYGAINATHMRQALEVLADFDWVLPVQSPMKSYVLEVSWGCASGARCVLRVGSHPTTPAPQMGLGFNSGVSFNRVAATTANQGGGGELPYAQAHGGIAPFSGDERAWLEALNRYDYELVQAARHIHALDVKSLRLLARFAPHAVAPPPAGEQAGKRHGKTCCGFTCRECVPGRGGQAREKAEAGAAVAGEAAPAAADGPVVVWDGLEPG